MAIKNGNVEIDDIISDPSAFSGNSADEIVQVLKEAGYYRSNSISSV